ncbi:hypothetical protein ACWIGI_12700 [Nocardia sp. NPDC055321]
MRRITLAATVFALGTALLTGCGGDDDDAYCSALKDLGSGSYVPDIANSETVPKLRAIADVSPDSVKADWLEFAAWQEKAMIAANSGIEPAGQLDPTVLERIVAYNEKTCMK